MGQLSQARVRPVPTNTSPNTYIALNRCEVTNMPEKNDITLQQKHMFICLFEHFFGLQICKNIVYLHLVNKRCKIKKFQKMYLQAPYPS